MDAELCPEGAELFALRAELAKARRQHEADLARASDITRGALEDRDAARAGLARKTEAREAIKKRVTPSWGTVQMDVWNLARRALQPSETRPTDDRGTPLKGT